MDTKRKRNGWIWSGIWVSGVVAVACIWWPSDGLRLNELGDFLAGTMAPLAIYWLILGFLQQGDELKQNTEALKQQGESLRLQVEELRQSTEQQKELVAANERQVELSSEAIRRAREKDFESIQPVLELKESIEGSRTTSAGKEEFVYLTYRNVGKIAADATFSASNGLRIEPGSFTFIDHGEHFKISLIRPEHCAAASEMSFEYEDIRGIRQTQTFRILNGGKKLVLQPFTPKLKNIASLSDLMNPPT